MIIQYTCVCHSTVVFVFPEFNKYMYHDVNFVISDSLSNYCYGVVQ